MPYNLGSINPLLMGMDRLYNQSSPYNFDPNGYVNPAMFPYMDQAYMRAILNMQNPALMFPQNTGSALGNAIGQILGGAAPNKFPQYAPQQQVQAPQQPQVDPVQAEIIRRVQQRVSSGANYPYALSGAVSDMMADPRYASNPQAMMTLDRFAQEAHKLGADPSIDERVRAENQYKYINLMGPDGKVRTMPSADPRVPGLMDAGYTEVAQRPQEPAGQVVKWGSGSSVMYGMRQADGSIKPISTQTSELPQYIREAAVNLSADEARSAGLLPQLSTAASSDKAKTDIANREVAVRNLDQQLQDVESALKGGAPTGEHVAALLEHADDIIGGAQQLAGTTDMKLLDPKNYNWTGLDGILNKLQVGGQQAIRLHSMLLSAAYMMEAAENHKDESDGSRKARIEQNMNRLADDVDDPKAMYSVVHNLRKMYIRNLQNEADEYGATLRYYGKGYKFDSTNNHDDPLGIR